MRPITTAFAMALLVVNMTTAQEAKTDAAAGKDNVPPQGFTSLFNGKDMTECAWHAESSHQCGEPAGEMMNVRFSSFFPPRTQ